MTDTEAYYREYFPRLGDVFSPEDTRRQIDFVLEVWGLASTGRVLDVGCGNGRHALELAARGFDVLAIDSSPTLLAVAQQRARARNLPITFEQRDMRTLTFKPTFDAILCMWSSFGFFGPATDEQVIGRLAGVLRSRGVLLLDIPNWIGPTQARDWKEYEDRFDLIERTLQMPERVADITTVVVEKADATVRRYHLRMYIYTPEQLAEIVERNGLTVVGIWGNYDVTAEFQPNTSHQLIVGAQKNAPDLGR